MRVARRDCENVQISKLTADRSGLSALEIGLSFDIMAFDIHLTFDL